MSGELPRVLLCAAVLALPGAALGQTPGTFQQGEVLKASDLNAAFATKQDYGSAGAFSTLTVSGTLQVGGTTPITGFGTAIGQALGPLINSGGSGHPGLNLSDGLILQRATRAATDFSDLQFNRTTTYTGGSGQINAMLRVTTSAGANDAASNWNLVGLCKQAGGGQCIGGVLTSQRQAGATGAIWGGILNAVDLTDAASTGLGATINEVDFSGNLADNGTNPSSFGGIGIRKGLQLVAIRQTLADTAQTEFSHGIWITTGNSGPAGGGGSDAHVNYDSAVGFAINAQARIALDTRGIVAPTGSSDPVFAVTMPAGQCIDFNGSASLTSNPGGNTLCFDSGTGKLFFSVAGVHKWSIDASGNVRAAGTVTGSTTP